VRVRADRLSSAQVPTIRAALLVLTLLAVVTRVAWLDADPPLLKSADELGDEGYWAHNARTSVVLGQRFPDDLAQGPAAAPLFDAYTASFANPEILFTTALDVAGLDAKDLDAALATEVVTLR